MEEYYALDLWIFIITCKLFYYHVWQPPAKETKPLNDDDDDYVNVA